MTFFNSKSSLHALFVSSWLAAALLLFASTPIIAQINGPYARQVQQMYVAYYGRPGDVAGVEYWASRLESVGGNWIDDLINAFGDSDEYRSRFGGLLDETLIDNLFFQMFGRTSDPAGRSFYIDLLNGTNQTGNNPTLRRSSLAAIALDIANGSSGADYVTLQNKLDFSQNVTDLFLTTGAPYNAEDISTAVLMTNLVSSSPASVQQVTSAVNALVNGNLPLAMLEIFKGSWVFNFTIVSAYTNTFYMNGVFSTTNGIQFLNGTDQFGNLANVAYYPERSSFFLYNVFGSIEQAFIFDFSSSNTISGCYHQDRIWDICYPLEGMRLTLGSAMSSEKIEVASAAPRDVTEQAIQRRTQNLEEALLEESWEMRGISSSTQAERSMPVDNGWLDTIIQEHREMLNTQ